MSSGESVTHWIAQLTAGEQQAAQKLWERYFGRLVGLARKKLRRLPRRVADEEDVVLSAFNSFFRGAQAGRFPQLADRDDLWRLLVVITARKASHLVRDEQRQKRGGGRVAVEPPRSSDQQALLEQIVDREPTPQFAAQVADECEQLLARLGDPDLAAVAVWKMEGYGNAEIAAKLGCAPRSVERKLQLIRSIWQQDVAGTRR